MGILDTAGSIGDVLAAMEAARAKGRVDQGDMQQRQANAAANIYRTQSDVALKGPLQSAKAAATGDQMANIQPFSWTGDTKQVGNLPVPQSTGGLTPANFGPATRKAGSDLATLSANRVSSPSFNIPKPPVLAPLPESNGLDSILGGASSIGTLLAALAKGGAPKAGAPSAPGAQASGGSVDLTELWHQIHPGNPDAGSPSHQEEDTRNGSTTGSASADGQPLPGVGDGNGYYDENGNYIDLTDFSGGGGSDNSGSNWWSE